LRLPLIDADMKEVKRASIVHKQRRERIELNRPSLIARLQAAVNRPTFFAIVALLRHSCSKRATSLRPAAGLEQK
jgi:hypothetical protein